ncbi:recombination protein RecR [Candidatus Parcubacteria bacterium]|nr:MAG: recombination protein RecR [Candidatus Parcubacteria bacterium]
MDAIPRLASLFERFPGIGPRQAERFVQFLLRSSPSLRRELVTAIESLGGSVRQCVECMRYFSGREKACSICTNKERDAGSLIVVASDADFAALEASSVYRGKYFVLGGTISLAKDMTNGLRIKQLLSSVPSRVKAGLQEVILAFPANPEGDATATHVREELLALTAGKALRITSLGRGLSTGSELEYADASTLKNAFESRR